MQQKLMAVITSNLDKTTSFSLDVKDLSFAERLKKALKKFFMFAIAMLVSLPIPVAHLILVPSFFCLSIYAFFSTLKKHHIIIGGKVSCPNCRSFQPMPAVSFNWPLTLVCTQCQLQIRLELNTQ